MRLAFALLLVACPAYASTYDTAAKVMEEVNQGHRYVNYSAKDFVPMEKGERGNCARFAATFAQKMKERGVETYHLMLTDSLGRGHAVALTHDGWVLDNQAFFPIRVERYMMGR
jgi:predicted transglutaminase-like cysteine proteinase